MAHRRGRADPRSAAQIGADRRGSARTALFTVVNRNRGNRRGRRLRTARSPAMTPPRFDTTTPLRTDADVLRRVRELVGPATADQLWLMFVDGDDRQAPVVVPVEDPPPAPDALVGALVQILAGMRNDLSTAAGPGSVILTRERRGPGGVLPADRAWADALTAGCAGAGVRLRGFFLSTPSGVRRV